MPRKEILGTLGSYINPFRITQGEGFRLADFDPADTLGFEMKKARRRTCFGTDRNGWR
jgi:hypothetical protein